MITKEQLKVGMTVRIKGDPGDLTDHLDGNRVGIVTIDPFRVEPESVYVEVVEPGPYYGDGYYVWMHNIIEIVEEE